MLTELKPKSYKEMGETFEYYDPKEMGDKINEIIRLLTKRHPLNFKGLDVVYKEPKLYKTSSQCGSYLIAAKDLDEAHKRIGSMHFFVEPVEVVDGYRVRLEKLDTIADTSLTD